MIITAPFTVGVRVKVTAKHIAQAYRLDARKCAISEAIVASDSDIVWANVTANRISFGRASDEMRYEFHTPSNAVDFIDAFDAGNGQPFTLELNRDDLVSMRPRQMRQAKKADERARATHVANVTGIDPRKLDRKALPVWDENGEVIQAKRPTSKVKAASTVDIPRDTPPPPPRAKKDKPVRKPGAPLRQYAKRPATGTAD